ncbi:syntaxin-binding protein-like protein 2 [Paraphaeosphaeria sporulosa]|uniref:Syntaxin-binding protein-like protein 2 n=1 Tax=Paraphaeosphaeria sporulosa TaxID=1460663 RepID=A0A177CR38_9PLEO|nr:syntaxin-binding protein-like protein 2 [Paraphaeosphaeria sporulosa]OAG09983.1 syntaxin-binding protein-like protein 2 [Paraphaeosphaeria sporulosa]
MGVSLIDIQRDLILSTIRNTTRGDWKVLVTDEESRKLIDNVVKEDDILDSNITNIERIEDRRQAQPDTDAVYFLTPKPHIIDCLMADFERRRYKGAFLIWTTLPAGPLRERLERSQMAQQQIRSFKVMHLDFHPRESHLVTFKDPWSFPILFHPECNNLVKHHMEEVAEKIVGVCVALGEYPTIRYYRPRAPTHEASVLCSHLARFAQDKLDMYAQYNPDFPPPSNRPRGALYITDRSMDLFAPLLHEFTYQAMVHDLLKLQEGDKVIYRTVIADENGEEEKDMEISDKDKIWVEYRHRHMKDTIDKLISDFQKFIADNPHFTNQDAANAGGMNGLNAIKDMMAGLPQFQQTKEAYSLNISMAQECMEIFQKQKLPDLASVEQCLATGLDEEYKKAKNMADQVIRTLDEDAVTSSDRLRLIALYVLYRDGILPADLTKLLLHAQLPLEDGAVVRNLESLGAHTARGLKDKREPTPPIFPRKTIPPVNAEEYALSRYEPVLKDVLEEHVLGRVPQDVFPYTKGSPEDPGMNDVTPASSLRSAKPTWAKSKLSSVEPRQRIIVFMAGGATYSEARACYEITEKTSRDVFLVTSHMMNPGLYLRQIGDLSQNRRALRLPADQPPPKAPAHLFEKPEPPKPAPPPAGMKPGVPGGRPNIPGGLPSRPGGSGAPPTAGMANMSLNSRPQGQPTPPPAPPGKHGKEEKEKKKKKHHFFSSSKS